MTNIPDDVVLYVKSDKGPFVRVKAVFRSEVVANAYMVLNENKSVIKVIDDLILIADSDDAGVDLRIFTYYKRDKSGKIIKNKKSNH